MTYQKFMKKKNIQPEKLRLQFNHVTKLNQYFMADYFCEIWSILFDPYQCDINANSDTGKLYYNVYYFKIINFMGAAFVSMFTFR